MGRKKKKGATGQQVHPPASPGSSSAFEAVYKMVRAIPPGRVATYGQLSNMIGGLLSPLAVGWALHSCPEDVPWQRVVNAAGRCSTERLPDMPFGLQRALLEAEGVEFDDESVLDLEKYRWEF